MKKEFFIAIAIGLSVLGILVFTAQSKPSEAQNDWVTYANQNLGLVFEHPNVLKPFPAKEVVFRDCETCPGAIHVVVDDAGGETVENILAQEKYKRLIRRGETLIDGNRAVIMSPAVGAEGDTGERSVYFVKGDFLYTVRARFFTPAEMERFWKSIRLVPN